MSLVYGFNVNFHNFNWMNARWIRADRRVLLKGLALYTKSLKFISNIELTKQWEFE